MLRVGLTGGLATGKSAAAGILRDLGASVFDADAIVRELYEPGGAGQAAARELFGDAVLDPHGRIDRARIAEIVFTDPEKRHALEARIHPMVIGEITRRFQEAEKAGAAVAVAEASQLLEARGDANLDRVLLIVAPRDERIRRWAAKGGETEDAERRIAAQIPPALAFDRASDVVANDGTLEDFRARIADVYRSWAARDPGRREVRPADAP